MFSAAKKNVARLFTGSQRNLTLRRTSWTSSSRQSFNIYEKPKLARLLNTEQKLDGDRRVRRQWCSERDRAGRQG